MGVPDPEPPDPDPPDPVPADGVSLDPDPPDPEVVPELGGEPEDVPDPAGGVVAVGVVGTALVPLPVDPPQALNSIKNARENARRRLVASTQRCERMWRMGPSGRERCVLSASMVWVVAAVR